MLHLRNLFEEGRVEQGVGFARIFKEVDYAVTFNALLDKFIDTLVDLWQRNSPSGRVYNARNHYTNRFKEGSGEAFFLSCNGCT